MTDRAALAPSQITPEQAAAFIRGRRTVDYFKPDVPDEAIVRQAIEVARWAPNHHLTEPWRFYLLGAAAQDAVAEINTQIVAASKGEEVAEAKRKRWRAVPGWLLVTCVDDPDERTRREDYAACACAIQNLMLYLHSASIASKWTTGAVTRDAGFLRACGIDGDTEYCVGLIWYGYAVRRPRSQRRTLDQIVFTCD